MKKLYLFVVAALCSTMIFAQEVTLQAGMYDVRVSMAANGGLSQEQVLVNDGTLEAGTANLGDLYAGIINDINVCVWKDVEHGWDITGVKCHYSLDGAAGDFIPMEWAENLDQNGHNQRWHFPSQAQNRDLISLVNLGAHTLTFDFTVHAKLNDDTQGDIAYPGAAGFDPAISVFTISFTKVAAPAPQRISLIPGAWAVDDAKIAIWYWNDNGLQGWSDFMAADQWGVSHVNIPAAATSLKFARFAPAVTAPAWGISDLWNDSKDNLVIGDCKQYVVSDDGSQAYDNGKLVGTWDCTSGLEELFMDGEAAKKVMYNGQVMIMRNGKLYDVKGAEMPLK